jgi:transcriptional regulator with XRE-family HTH domain
MRIIEENIKTIRDFFGLSYAKFGERISASLQKEDKYSKDKVFNFENGKTNAEKDQVFIRLLSELSGVSEPDLLGKKISASDLKPKDIYIEDAILKIADQQIKEIAFFRVMLGFLAEIHSSSMGVSAETLKDRLISKVEDEVLEMKKELKQK